MDYFAARDSTPAAPSWRSGAALISAECPRARRLPATLETPRAAAARSGDSRVNWMMAPWAALRAMSPAAPPNQSPQAATDSRAAGGGPGVSGYPEGARACLGQQYEMSLNFLVRN